MYLLKRIFLFFLLLLFSCGSGGALTPSESFNAVKSAVEKQDSEAIFINLTEGSKEKIGKHNRMMKEMKTGQLSFISGKYGFSIEKLRNLKDSDAVSLYFFSDVTGVKLSRYFKESIVSIDIRGKRAVVKTESGIQLDFLREGPYWKFDMSNL
ncbi:MAG: hypothetical protein CVV49_00745 [Spirochaetae bacterium HGW-Spirochaetae-5]|nr:MAG: hypothetical protein CVV49_00745 [Spirochaetae bacterium HGW-Spirochaetae-5]